jgi:hypothetical protein
VLEETGWEPGSLCLLTRYHPSNGPSDQTFHLFVADGAKEVGAPVDWYESEKVEWLPTSRVVDEMTAGRIGDGLSLTALSWAMAFGELPGWRRHRTVKARPVRYLVRATTVSPTTVPCVLGLDERGGA